MRQKETIFWLMFSFVLFVSGTTYNFLRNLESERLEISGEVIYTTWGQYPEGLLKRSIVKYEINSEIYYHHTLGIDLSVNQCVKLEVYKYPNSILSSDYLSLC